MLNGAQDCFNVFVGGLIVWEEERAFSVEEGTAGNYRALPSKPMCKYPVMSLWILRLENSSASEIECERHPVLHSVIPMQPEPTAFKQLD